MARFTVRVELRDAVWEDYETLHAGMVAEGFARYVTATSGPNKGTTYKLPAAEYSLVGRYTRRQALVKARLAAGETGKAYAVLVTESVGRTWYGLDEA